MIKNLGIPIGIYEKALPYSINWRKRFEIAKDIGFDYVEISIDESPERQERLEWPLVKRKELRNLSIEMGTPLFSMCLSAHRQWALGSKDKEIRTKALEIMKKAIELASDLNTRIIQIMGYYVFYEEVSQDAQKRYIESLYQGVEWAEKAGVMLGLENVDGYVNINCIEKAMRIVDEINSPWFQLYSDFANLPAFQFDMVNELEKGKGHFVAMHVKDSELEEVRRIPFGEGIVNFSNAFNTLFDLGYRGPFMLEMWNDDSPESVDRITDALQKTREILRNSRYGDLTI